MENGARGIKPYETLEFTDDFIFWKVLTTDLDLCKELLELILDVKIRKIVVADGQDTIQLEPDNRGIRLDVLYIDDEHGTVYDIDMQTSITDELVLRIRYYQSVIDLNMLERGGSFLDLRNSFVIFICLEDMFDRGRSVYRFRNVCVDDDTLELGDGTEKVILNAAGDREGLSEKMCNFLDYLLDHKATDDFTSWIEESVKTARNNPKWRQDYMKYEADKAVLEAEIRKEDEKKMRGGIRSLINSGTPISDLYTAFGKEVVDKALGKKA